MIMDYSTILRNKTLFNEENEALESENVDKGSVGEAKTDQAFLDAMSGKDKEEVSDTSAETTGDARKDKEEVSDTSDKPVENAAEPVDETAKKVAALKQEIQGKIDVNTVTFGEDKVLLEQISAKLETPEALEALSKDFDNLGEVSAAIKKDLAEHPIGDAKLFNESRRIFEDEAPIDDYWTIEKIEARYNNGLSVIIVCKLTGKQLNDNNKATIVSTTVSFYVKKTNNPNLGGDESDPKADAIDKIQLFLEELKAFKDEFPDQADQYVDDLILFADTHIDDLKKFADKKNLLEAAQKTEDKALIATCKDAIDLVYFITFISSLPTSMNVDAFKNFILGKAESEEEKTFLNTTMASMIQLLYNDPVKTHIVEKYSEVKDDSEDKEELSNPTLIQTQSRTDAEALRNGGYREDWANCMLQYAKIARAATLTIEAARRAGLVDDVVLKLCAGLGVIGGILRVAGMFLPRGVGDIVTSAASCMVYASTTVASGSGLIKELKKPGKKNVLNILALSSGMIMSGMGLARSGSALITNIKDTAFYNQTVELINDPDKTVNKINSEMDALEKQKANYVASGDTEKIAEIEQKQAALQESKDVAVGFQNMSPEERQNVLAQMDLKGLPQAAAAAREQTDAAARRGEAFRQAQIEAEASRRLEQNIGMTISEFQGLPENIKADQAKAFITAHANEGTAEANWYANAIASGDPETINKAKQIKAYVNSCPERIQAAQHRNDLLAVANSESPEVVKDGIKEMAVSGTALAEKNNETVVDTSASNTGDAGNTEGTPVAPTTPVSEIPAEVKQTLTPEQVALADKASSLDSQLTGNSKTMTELTSYKGNIESQIAALQADGVTSAEKGQLFELNRQLNNVNQKMTTLSYEQNNLMAQKHALVADPQWDALAAHNIGFGVDNFTGIDTSAGCATDFKILHGLNMGSDRIAQYESGLVQGIENGSISNDAQLKDYINSYVTDPKAQNRLFRNAESHFGTGLMDGNDRIVFTKEGLTSYFSRTPAEGMPIMTPADQVARNQMFNNTSFQNMLTDYSTNGGTTFDQLTTAGTEMYNNNMSALAANRG